MVTADDAPVDDPPPADEPEVEPGAEPVVAPDDAPAAADEVPVAAPVELPPDDAEELVEAALVCESRSVCSCCWAVWSVVVAASTAFCSAVGSRVANV
ncbi:MAG: hypothetical protein B7X41_14185 [Microbacterium sp. 14-71-5]|nr:MAG: hypothetical protein B7X41_14185 [Microbacterium sp. 14-71-5]